jgi:hypothetical protein
MKVLFLASKPDSDADLNLTREITELQERFWSTSSEPVIFQILPDLKVEEVPEQLGRFLPDVLHISAHSNNELLSLSGADGSRRGTYDSIEHSADTGSDGVHRMVQEKVQRGPA